jgi:hypothetical protein
MPDVPPVMITVSPESLNKTKQKINKNNREYFFSKIIVCGVASV